MDYCQSFLSPGDITIDFTPRLPDKLPSIPGNSLPLGWLKDDLMQPPDFCFPCMRKSSAGLRCSLFLITSNIGGLPGSLSSWALAAFEQGEGCSMSLESWSLVFYLPLTTAASWEMPDGCASEQVFSLFNWCLWSHHWNDTPASFNISHLPAGILKDYFVKWYCR